MSNLRDAVSQLSSVTTVNVNQQIAELIDEDSALAAAVSALTDVQSQIQTLAAALNPSDKNASNDIPRLVVADNLVGIVISTLETIGYSPPNPTK